MYGGIPGICCTCGSSFFGPTACRIWIPACWSQGATCWTTSFSRRAPWEPPETSRVGRLGSRPNIARASGRTAARSRVAMERRSGMPMYRASRSLLSGVETATRAA